MEINSSDIISFRKNLDNKINNNLFIDYCYNLTGNIIRVLLYLEDTKVYFNISNQVPEKSIHFQNINKLVYKVADIRDVDHIDYLSSYIYDLKEGNIRNKIICSNVVEFLNTIPIEVSNEIIKEYLLFKINIEKYLDRIKGRKKV